MLYDPFLSKETFKSKPWYEEFLIFHNIGVCQVPNEHTADIREALARFLFATKTTQGKGPGTTFIIGTGAIEIGDMEAYIQVIHRKHAVNLPQTEDPFQPDASEKTR